jgi:hypothetical protein
MAKEKKYTVTSPPIHMEEEMRDAIHESAKKTKKFYKKFHKNKSWSYQAEYRELIAIGLKTKNK